jgi:sulfate adenylyltransferase large subunit
MTRDLRIEDVAEYLAQHERKELLRFVAVGSVDDGKSTLIGRMLYDSHGIYEDQLAAVERASKKKGSAGGKLDLALLTDGLRAEREQGITIDVAYRYFSTDRRKFIIADTPGHVQYTRNMATGASTATVALILIDARHGVLQQSRRHAYIASLLGIPHLAVCVNKMDLVDFDSATYEAIKADFSAFSKELRFREVKFLPVSAVDGDNVVHQSTNTPWYSGGTLLDYLETVPLADGTAHPFRYPVQYVLRPDLSYRGFCGQVASGVVRKGDAVMVLPSRKTSTIAAIDTFAGEIDEAYAPMSVTLRLADEVDISRGDMIVHAEPEQSAAPTMARRFEAQVVWMSSTELSTSKSFFLKHTTRIVRANIDVIHGEIDLEKLTEIKTDRLQLNDIGRVDISCNQPIYFDPYSDNRHMGAFVLIDALTNDTVGAGMIVREIDDTTTSRRGASRSGISSEERRARLGHRGVAVWFDGDPDPAQPTIAYALERALYDRGVLATVIDVDALADGTRSAELFADIAFQCVDAGLVVIFSSGLPRLIDREQLRAKLSSDSSLIVASSAAEQGSCVINTDDAKAAVAAIAGALQQAGFVDALGSASHEQP